VRREPVFQGDSPSGQLQDIMTKIEIPANTSSLDFVQNSPSMFVVD